WPNISDPFTALTAWTTSRFWLAISDGTLTAAAEGAGSVRLMALISITAPQPDPGRRKKAPGVSGCQVSYRPKTKNRERRLSDRLVAGNMGQGTEEHTRRAGRLKPAGSARGTPFQGHAAGRTGYPVSRPRAMVLAQRFQAPVRAE